MATSISRLDPSDCHTRHSDSVSERRLIRKSFSKKRNRLRKSRRRSLAGARRGDSRRRGFQTDEYIDDGLRCCCFRDRRLELRRRLVEQRRFRIHVAHERVGTVGRAELAARWYLGFCQLTALNESMTERRKPRNEYAREELVSVGGCLARVERERDRVREQSRVRRVLFVVPRRRVTIPHVCQRGYTGEKCESTSG